MSPAGLPERAAEERRLSEEYVRTRKEAGAPGGRSSRGIPGGGALGVATSPAGWWRIRMTTAEPAPARSSIT
ncbi:MAG: hypothetical protein MZU97_12235 [Bacillus subtilis]|nr:hypothetical protein [Bacillus subtilis]